MLSWCPPIALASGVLVTKVSEQLAGDLLFNNRSSALETLDNGTSCSTRSYLCVLSCCHIVESKINVAGGNGDLAKCI